MMTQRHISRSAGIVAILASLVSCAAGRSATRPSASSSITSTTQSPDLPSPSASDSVGKILVPNVLLEDADHDASVTVSRGTLIALLLGDLDSGPAVSSNDEVVRTMVSAPGLAGGTETIFRAEHDGSAVLTGPAENQSLTFDIFVTDPRVPLPVPTNRDESVAASLLATGAPAVVLARGSAPRLLTVSPGTVVEADLNPPTIDIPSSSDETVARPIYRSTDGDTLRLFWQAVAPGYVEIQSHYGVACPAPPYPCATPYAINVSVIPVAQLSMPAVE